MVLGDRSVLVIQLNTETGLQGLLWNKAWRIVPVGRSLGACGSRGLSLDTRL